MHTSADNNHRGARVSDGARVVGGDPDVARVDAPRVSFGVLLAVIAGVGVLIRIVYILVVIRHVKLFPDSVWYLIQAKNVRSGIGYVDVGRQFGAFNGHGATAGNVDTAYWPPLYTLFLAGVQSIFGEAVRTSQLAGIGTGAATIVLTGLLGRELAGRTIGLLAAVIVALSPFAIAVDGSLMSETLYVPLVLLALLFAHRARMHTGALYWCLFGGTIGLAGLTRQDALFLILVALIPAAVLSRDPVAPSAAAGRCGARRDAAGARAVGDSQRDRRRGARDLHGLGIRRGRGRQLPRHLQREGTRVLDLRVHAPRARIQAR